MKRLAALLVCLAMPAQASVEVGADVGVVTRAGGATLAPGGLVGFGFDWRFAESHALGVGLRTMLPFGGLPAPRVRYTFDFDAGGLRATLPVSLGAWPELYCAADACRSAAEARAGFGLQVFDDFRAPWVTLEIAAPLGVPRDQWTMMVGLHVSMRWEPLPEELE